MNELVKTQTCPFCGNEVDDSHAEWEDENNVVECDRCKKEYSVTPTYHFLGWEIEKICTGCGSVESECFCDESEVEEVNPQ